MKNKIASITLLFGATVCIGYTSCISAAASEKQTVPILPEILSDQTFIYDELKNGDGDSLYTLSFSEDGYRLYKDKGLGIVAEGTVSAAADKSLVFQSEDLQFEGSYTGSAFQSPSVTVEFNGKNMTFVPDTESGEYVYLAYLGVFEWNIGARYI